MTISTRIKSSVEVGTFRALRHRNYRIFFTGQLVSLVGTWITTVATSWLVYRLTGSEFLLGVVGFAGQFPSFLLAPLAGVLVDRWNRQRVLIATQVCSMLQSFALAALALSGTIEVWSICVLNVLQAFINAFDMPARQSFVNEMIEDRADLPNAIALNSAMFNAARLVGPSIGGIIIAASNEGVCFLIDGLSYFAVMLSLFKIKISKPAALAKPSNILTGLHEGGRYAFGFTPIRWILLLVASMSLLGTPQIILMPVFAREVLHGGPGLLGLLMAASGCGALLGALRLASRRNIAGIGKIIATSGFLLGVALCVFSFSRVIWLSLLANFLAGGSLITLLAGCNTVIQSLVDDDKRGRVMSFYMMAFMGMMPLGSLLAGLIAQRFGAPFTVMLGSGFCILISAVFLRILPVIREQAREAMAIKRGQTAYHPPIAPGH